MIARLGLALYTLRDDLARDPDGTLRAVAEMGYEGVELYDLFGREAGISAAPDGAATLAALGLATSYAVAGDRLDLFRPGGTFAVTFERN